ncbi:hypothetical protein [Streptomyces sp. NPDC060194]|uniref:hypothetical protein n=1 Tax=Streptomyces sp. NPDC060194 TaxID=3347069 RepID=UPI00365758B5
MPSPSPVPPLAAVGPWTVHDAGHAWDALRVPRQVGLAAKDILGARCGALLEGHNGELYYFVTPGSATGWNLLNTTILSAGDSLTVPPLRRAQGPGLHWRICPGGGDWLTDGAALRAALEDVLSAGRLA